MVWKIAAEHNSEETYRRLKAILFKTRDDYLSSTDKKGNTLLHFVVAKSFYDFHDELFDLILGSGNPFWLNNQNQEVQDVSNKELLSLAKKGVTCLDIAVATKNVRAISKILSDTNSFNKPIRSFLERSLSLLSFTAKDSNKLLNTIIPGQGKRFNEEILEGFHDNDDDIRELINSHINSHLLEELKKEMGVEEIEIEVSSFKGGFDDDISDLTDDFVEKDVNVKESKLSSPESLRVKETVKQPDERRANATRPRSASILPRDKVKEREDGKGKKTGESSIFYRTTVNATHLVTGEEVKKERKREPTSSYSAGRRCGKEKKDGNGNKQKPVMRF